MLERKVAAIIWAVCLVVLASVAARPASAGDYTSARHGFSIHVLPGWETTEFNDRNDGVVVLFKGPDGALIMVNLAPEPFDPDNKNARDKVLDGYLDALENGGVQNIEIIDEGEPEMETGRGYSMHYTYQLPNGVLIENVSTFIPGAGTDRHFVITFAAVPQVYNTLIEEAGKIISGFKIQDKDENGQPNRGKLI